MDSFRNRPSWRLTALAFALAPLVRCTNLNAPKPLPCPRVVTLTATPGLEPRFAWTPNCLVDGVLVEEVLPPSAGGPQPRWFIIARIAGQGTGSPVQYGQVPASMAERYKAVTLATGHRYSVRLNVDSIEVAAVDFVP